MAGKAQAWNSMSLTARLYVGVMVGLGTAVLAVGAMHPTSHQPMKFACYLLVAVLASRLKVNLPGILELSFAETLALGCAAILTQCFYRDRPNTVQVVFNTCATAFAIALAFCVYHVPLFKAQNNPAVLLVATAAVYFAANTVPVATIISLTEHKSLRRIWADCYFWSFPYYLVGAGVAGLVTWLNKIVEWQTSLLILPAVYLIYRSYRLYLARLEDEKGHVEEMANLHMRTIEALALAIEAKDHTTHDHLQRVRVYAVEVAKELRVSPEEMEALQAAALLHDIGKLAVPEHIISKPGRLTPEEFEKMKIHPVVGAEILERVRFPYPVVPIVRAHHEKYDGSGYPFGLKGDEIPIGARILSAVDFLDALASDRQYRRAMKLEEVMERLKMESGRSFDPRVVNVLLKRYRDLEQLVLVRSEAVKWSKLSTDVKVERGLAPAAGFVETGGNKSREGSFLSSIAAA